MSYNNPEVFGEQFNCQERLAEPWLIATL